jgi:SAM-dependent methyltransferase
MSGAGDACGARRPARPTAAAHDPDAAEATEAHREYIRRKSFLRRIYLEHYRFFASEISGLPAGIAVELGSGGGFLRDVIPEVLTTDVVPLSTVQAVVSATALPFRDGSVRAILMINVLHHVQDPERFFAEATRCLAPGGKIVMVEPADTPFSRFVYTRFHHERFDPDMPGWRLPAGGRLSSANDALPGIIFERDRELFRSRFPELSVERFEHIMPISYILSGGVKPWALLPGAAYPVVRAIERSLGPLKSRLGLFTRIVIRRSAGGRPAPPCAS